MKPIDWIALAGLAGVAYWLYRCARRGMLRRSVVNIVLTVVLIAFGTFVVYYGKLWHAWIFPVKNWQGVFRDNK
jgi:hypothetical protein